MRVIRNINNNVSICLDDNNHEVVAFGKGIGFQRPPYEIELSQIDRTYYNLDAHYLALLDEIPEEVMDVTLEIVDKGSAYLGMHLNRVFLFSLSDHIHFAIQNTKKGLVISNPMVNEIQHMYEKEMLLGKWALKQIERKLSVKLPSGEAANIAMHFINAELSAKKEQDKDDMTRFIDDITEIVESEMNVIIDHNSFSYSRFVTHLKYLLKRFHSKAEFVDSDNAKMYEQMLEEFPELGKVVEKIRSYIMIQLDIDPSKEELLYLMMHINRVCAKEGL